jgi:hypothetical protein
LEICVAFLAGCAKTTLIASAPKDGDAYRKAKTIYVVLKQARLMKCGLLR